MIFQVTSSRRTAQVPRSAGFQQCTSSEKPPQVLVLQDSQPRLVWSPVRPPLWHPHSCTLTCDTASVQPHLWHPHLWHLTCAPSPVYLHLWHPHLWHLTCAPSPDTLTCVSSPVRPHLWHLHLCILTYATSPVTPLSPVTSLSPMTPSPVYPHLCILTCETSLVQLHLWHPSHLWQPLLYILTCSSWQSTLQSTLTPR